MGVLNFMLKTENKNKHPKTKKSLLKVRLTHTDLACQASSESRTPYSSRWSFTMICFHIGNLPVCGSGAELAF